MNKLEHYLLEPFSTLSHFIGAIASLLGLILLLIRTWDEPGKLVSMLIYGLSMIFLYSSSSLLHGIKTNDDRRMWLNRLDHIAIFLLIAGTYTPIAYNLFPDPWRWAVLTTVWPVVLIGAAFKAFNRRIHGFFNASIYVFLGWGGAVPLVFAANLIALVPLRGLLLVLLGGLIYTAGFFIYCWQRPDPWPGVFGHHEIWHLFVLGGSLCHFLFILFYVVPFERV